MGDSRTSDGHPRSPVGYLVCGRDGLWGQQGIAYDYVLAGSGVYVQAESPLLRARVRAVPAEVRGLARIDEKVDLVHGPIPGGLFHQALRFMVLAAPLELFVAVVWDKDAYRLVLPAQTTTGASVKYDRPENVVFEAHSHGSMQAFFSGTDNADEQGFRVYGVCGKLLDARPQVNFRVGIYGFFAPVSWPELFSGPPPDVTFKGEFHDSKQEEGQDVHIVEPHADR